MNKNQGFTLIELLVVVLIIGILSAVALPQYEKAVEKSRAAEGIQLSRAIFQAQQVYFMANGQYTDNLAELDLEVPGESISYQGTVTQKTKLFNCRAIEGGTSVTTTNYFAVCRRNDKPYSLGYARNSTNLSCVPANDEGIKLCKTLTGKTESPYEF